MRRIWYAGLIAGVIFGYGSGFARLAHGGSCHNWRDQRREHFMNEVARQCVRAAQQEQAATARVAVTPPAQPVAVQPVALQPAAPAQPITVNVQPWGVQPVIVQQPAQQPAVQAAVVTQPTVTPVVTQPGTP